jgi:hypothetical protein
MEACPTESGARANEREARRKVVKTVAPLLYALPEDYSYRVVFCLRPHLKAAWSYTRCDGQRPLPRGNRAGVLASFQRQCCQSMASQSQRKASVTAVVVTGSSP